MSIVEGKSFDEDSVMTPEEEKVFDALNYIDADIVALIGKVRSQIPSSREASLVATKLEEARLWLTMVPLS